MDNQIGMWAPRPTPSRPVIFHPTATVSNSGELIITSVQPKGVGWQDPEEYVEIRNTSAFPIQLKGWRLSDLKGHAFNFVDFIINPGNYCRIYTNAYHPEHCGLSFYSLSPVWNEPQDCVLLFNAYGNLVDQYCYGW